MAEPGFLIVRLGSMGDIVHTFPAAAALRESFPDAEIIWLTHPKWEMLVRSSSLPNEVWTVDTREWAPLGRMLSGIRRRRFQAAIDYQGLWKSASIPFLARVPTRIGFSSETVRERGVPLFYTDRVRVNPAAHMVDQNGALSVRAGAKSRTGNMNLRIPPEDIASAKRKLQIQGITEYVVLSPGGGWRSKCWP